ncbi:MAG: hypothetical protein ACM3QX_09520 [Syntrophomonadaceae bacterium]
MLNRFLKLSAFIALAAVSTLKAQTIDTLNLRNSRLKINVHAGIEFNQLGNLRSSFVEIRDYLRALDIGIPDQLVHPRSNAFGASVLFSLKDRMYFGAGFEHLSSEANLLYGDAVGTADLNCTLDVNKFLITGQYVLPYKRYFSPFAEMNLGVLSAKYEFTNKIRFYQPFPENMYEKSSGERNTLVISLFLGAQNNVYKNIVLFEKLGYQFSSISGIPVKVESDVEHSPVTTYTYIDLRGLLLQFGAEYQL